MLWRESSQIQGNRTNKPDRIIISSSDHAEMSEGYNWPFEGFDSWKFTQSFVDALKKDDTSIWAAFDSASGDNPQLDADGDGWSQENEFIDPYTGNDYEEYSYYLVNDVPTPYEPYGNGQPYKYNEAGPDGVTDQEIAEATYI